MATLNALIRKTLRAAFNYDPSFCDMYEDAHASSAAEEYLSHIRPAIREQFGDRTLTILDAGCQAGRLLIPLAQEGHRLIGVDTSAFALRRTRQHAKTRRLAVRLHRGNIANLRRWVAPRSLDVAICTEVLYLCRDHRDLLRLLAESVKPGGLVCISHRPPVFYVGAALRKGELDAASSVVRRIDGPSPDGAYHNWQTPQQLEGLYREVGLRVLHGSPVDHTAMSLDLSAVRDLDVTQLLAPAHQGNSTYRIPQYFLIIAQRTA